MADENFIGFIVEHENDDPSRLLLSASRWPDIDVRRAARIIEARRRIRDKIPSWHSIPEIEYPGSLSLEQCSSDETSRYKQRFVPEAARIADLTGGLGVDFLAIAAMSAEAHYCERSEALCEAARHNFPLLAPGLAGRLHIHQGDGVEWLKGQQGRFGLVYLDPARRDGASRRVYSIADCEPNLLEIKDLLLQRSDRVLAKVSPMADISRTLEQIPETREVHIVASQGEVKEMLLLIEAPEAKRSGPPLIVAADGASGFQFTLEEEREAQASYAGNAGKYLFQPSRALLKAGAFRLVSRRLGLKKLAPSTHLYTSDTPVEGFPGKTFEVEEAIPWSGAAARQLKARFPRIEMTALNFPLDTDALRKRLGIPQGGDRHLFATTLNDNSKTIIICKPCATTTLK